MRIGCAGWSIPPRYAARFPRAGSTLERYAQVFDSVEVNSSFHRPHRPDTWRRWAQSVPPHFRFSVKMPRAISHDARLRGCGPLLDDFLAQVLELGASLGCLLLQLPPSLEYDAPVVSRFFAMMRRRYDGPLVCEPRHRSWFARSVARALARRRVGIVAADPARVPRAAIPAGDRTVEYARLHGSPRMYYDAYPDAAIERIARRLARASRATRERWVIFDNTTLGHATADALRLRERLARDAKRPRARAR